MSARTATCALFFGLSGTGKTTLSADPNRTLIGDDEHGWAPERRLQFRRRLLRQDASSCRRKPSRKSTPRPTASAPCWKTSCSIRKPAFCDYDSDKKTENTRSAYPIEFMPLASRTGRAGQPKNIVFLTADAFGVMPPIAKLTPAQAMYHFLSGYTAKVAGTEKGLVGVEPEFSTCFAAPFLPRPPAEYGNLLRELHQEAQCRLLAGQFRLDRRHLWRRPPHADQGDARAGHRRARRHRCKNASYRTDPYFGFAVPTSVPGVEPHLLYPMKTWKDKAAFDETARKLVRMFQENFTKYEKHVDADVRAAAPEVRLAAE